MKEPPIWIVGIKCIADYLGVGYQAFRLNWMRKYNIPMIKAGSWRARRKDLDKWLAYSIKPKKKTPLQKIIED